jgi:hypothetical protein
MHGQHGIRLNFFKATAVLHKLVCNGNKLDGTDQTSQGIPKINLHNINESLQLIVTI